jgi:hypothetical protein
MSSSVAALRGPCTGTGTLTDLVDCPLPAHLGLFHSFQRGIPGFGREERHGRVQRTQRRSAGITYLHWTRWRCRPDERLRHRVNVDLFAAHHNDRC